MKTKYGHLVHKVSIDFETYSESDLRKVGAYAYARHESTDILACSYSVDDGPVQRWKIGSPYPFRDLHMGHVYAFNAEFERQIWNHVAARRYGWPQLEPHMFICTAALARLCSLPGKLENAARILNLRTKKDMEGHNLMLQLCRPRMKGFKDERAFHPDGPRSHHTPEKIARLEQYCDDDVRAEMEILACLPEPAQADIDNYHVNERINERGLPADLDFARVAVSFAAEEKQWFCEQLAEITGGAVTSPSQHVRIKDWIEPRLSDDAYDMTLSYDKGVKKMSMDKGTRENLLLEHALSQGAFLDDDVAEFIDILDQAGKSTIAKYQAMIDRSIDDPKDYAPRAHGVYMFAGGQQTGRFSSTGIQVHNLYRLSDKDPLYKTAGGIMDDMIAGNADAVRGQLDAKGKPVHAIHTLAKLVRPTICGCPRGDVDLVWGDWSAIEARVLPWLSKDKRALERLEIFARGEDIYTYTAAALGLEDRQTGKVVELACFAAATLVLTNNGHKPIAEVLDTDLLWDGGEWVNHRGVVARSARPVVNVDGIEVTPDHLFLVAQKWLPARQLVSNASNLSRALETGLASLRLWRTFMGEPVACSTASCNVHAEPHRITFKYPTYIKAQVRAAISALKKLRDIGLSSIGGMPISSPMTPIAGGYSTEYRRALTAAQSQKIADTRIMADVGYPCIGGKIGALFLRISSRLTDGITQSSSWIVKKLTETTRPETSNSLRARLTNRIDEKFRSCSNAFKRWKKRTPNCVPVFDIMNAGPHNRFTVISNSGAFVVHNCGFGGGEGSFQAMAKVYGVQVASHTAQNMVKAWREANPWAPDFWQALSEASIAAVETPGIAFQAGRLWFEYDRDALGGIGAMWMTLPSKRRLCYPGARIELVKTKWGGEKYAVTAMKAAWKPKEGAKDWPRVALWHGLLAENPTQAAAADLLMDALYECEAAGLTVVGHTHDEIMLESSRPKRDAALLKEIMEENPPWAAGLPLAAETGSGFRYKAMDI